jgi:hypothetical protein
MKQRSFEDPPCPLAGTTPSTGAHCWCCSWPAGRLIPYRPVLAVVADIPAYPPKPVRELIRISLPYFHKAVAVPFVQRWRGLSGDYLTPEAANILDPQVVVFHELRDFAKAMQTLARAVAPLLPAAAPTETAMNAARLGLSRGEPPAAPNRADSDHPREMLARTPRDSSNDHGDSNGTTPGARSGLPTPQGPAVLAAAFHCDVYRASVSPPGNFNVL